LPHKFAFKSTFHKTLGKGFLLF